jgi:Cys-tRNA(Pro)/Cys-tRNA(Cys) deacylase
MKVKKSPRSSPGSTPAIQTLSKAGIPFTVHTFDTQSFESRLSGSNTGYGIAAAEALGVEHDRVFKTLLVSVHGTKHPVVVAVVPVTTQLNLKSFATVLEAKRTELLDPASAERITGYVVGGISPFGQRRRLPTIIDQTALSWDTIFVSAGRRGSDVEMSPSDLIHILEATTAAISDRV